MRLLPPKEEILLGPKNSYFKNGIQTFGNATQSIFQQKPPKKQSNGFRLSAAHHIIWRKKKSELSISFSPIRCFEEKNNNIQTNKTHSR